MNVAVLVWLPVYRILPAATPTFRHSGTLAFYSMSNLYATYHSCHNTPALPAILYRLEAVTTVDAVISNPA